MLVLSDKHPIWKGSPPPVVARWIFFGILVTFYFIFALLICETYVFLQITLLQDEELFRQRERKAKKRKQYQEEKDEEENFKQRSFWKLATSNNFLRGIGSWILGELIFSQFGIPFPFLKLNPFSISGGYSMTITLQPARVIFYQGQEISSSDPIFQWIQFNKEFLFLERENASKRISQTIQKTSLVMKSGLQHTKEFLLYCTLLLILISNTWPSHRNLRRDSRFG